MVAGTAVSPQVAKQVLSIRKFSNIRHLDLYFPCSRTYLDSTKYRRRVLAFVEYSFPHIKNVTATEASQTQRSSKWLANKMEERDKRWGQPQLTPKQAEGKRALKRCMAMREKVIKALHVKA
ncbi:hypothetical protein ABVK25_005706 [Lepraria finkii]|uniref:Uncharacterized protein n=1 Tax=Lepraria finkii TaxID=1340010 RepID=A0ABR4B9V3_9LECA